MRISIIPEDKKIIVDGRTVDLEDDAPWDFDDETIHAIQWRDGRGELEYEDTPGEDPAPNKVFGEDEFNTIIQPYLDYFNTFLDVYEKKELESALKEEENLAAQIEELNLDKLEKEAQLVIIEDLQRQNKELRDERENLYDEKSKKEQALEYEKQNANIQLEREKAARESEKAGLEAQKADEFFEKKSLELSKKYDELYHDFEKEKEHFVEERKQYQELLQMERDKIEREIDDSEKNLALEDKERAMREEMIAKVRLLEEEQLDISKIEIEAQKQVLEIIELENKEVQDQINLNRERIQRELERERTQFEIQKEQELDIIMRAHEDLLNKMSQEEAYDELDDAVEREFEKAEVEYKKVQKQKLESSYSSGYAAEQEKLIRTNIERQEIESGEDKSIDEILTLMDGIDPEQLYTTLTDNERDDNSFPAEKAVKWFAALKDVLDKNS
jgi:hypothetical protein